MVAVDFSDTASPSINSASMLYAAKQKGSVYICKWDFDVITKRSITYVYSPRRMLSFQMFLCVCPLQYRPLVRALFQLNKFDH